MNEAEMRRILERAQEIEASGSGMAYEDLIKAASEAGIKTESVLQAIQERLGIVERPLKVDEFVFVRLPSGELYPGNVRTILEGSAEVELCSNATVTVPIGSIQRFHGLPGERVRVRWSWLGWRTCTVEEMNKEGKMALVRGPFGRTKYFMLYELRGA